MNLTTKIAMAAGALTLTAGGIAAAVTAPEAAEPGLSTAEEHVGTELPATKDAHPEATESEESSEGPQAEDNHGAEVSAVATSDETTGREHGEAVSTVARDNHGAEVSAEHGEDDDDQGDDVDDQGEDADEADETDAGRP